MMSPVARAGETDGSSPGGTAVPVAAGKRAGSRRGPRRRRRVSRALLGLALAITACVVAWGYLVYAAVDFGRSARGGDSTAWWFLAIATVGAVACLFIGLMLVARVLRLVGITSGPDRGDGDEPARAAGGRRAAR
jgi:hypothetical protein